MNAVENYPAVNIVNNKTAVPFVLSTALKIFDND
jgi:hypothetical protein